MVYLSLGKVKVLNVKYLMDDLLISCLIATDFVFFFLYLKFEYKNKFKQLLGY